MMNGTVEYEIKSFPRVILNILDGALQYVQPGKFPNINVKNVSYKIHTFEQWNSVHWQSNNMADFCKETLSNSFSLTKNVFIFINSNFIEIC